VVFDAAWNAAGKAVQRGKGFRIEGGAALPSDGAQTVLDVATGLILIDRPQVIGGHHALTQLLHVGALQDAAELGLAQQKGLDQRALVVLEV